MTDPVDSLLIDVRASTDGFAQDIQAMRGTFDSTLVDGFSKAGGVLERGLLGAIRRGSLGFDDLRRVALSALSEIAASAVQGVFANIGGASGASGGLLGSLLNAGGGLVGSILGLPGRATGGPVSPGRGYLVGERGPELFVPTTSGRIDNGGGRGSRRDVKVSIAIVAPAGSSAPQSLQRSSRQVASAVRRALTSY